MSELNRESDPVARAACILLALHLPIPILINNNAHITVSCCNLHFLADCCVCICFVCFDRYKCWLEWLSVAKLDGDASPSAVLSASTILPTSSSINRLIVTCFYFELYWANGDRDEAAGCTSSDPAPSPHHQYILSSCDTRLSSGIRHVLSCSWPG